MGFIHLRVCAPLCGVSALVSTASFCCHLLFTLLTPQSIDHFFKPLSLSCTATLHISMYSSKFSITISRSESIQPENKNSRPNLFHLGVCGPGLSLLLPRPHRHQHYFLSVHTLSFPLTYSTPTEDRLCKCHLLEDSSHHGLIQLPCLPSLAC